MKGLEPQIEVRGQRKAAIDLRQLGERSSDIRRVSEKVRSIYRKSNERRFDTSGSGTWPPLAADTKERKARAGLDPRPMRATGALYRSLTSPRASDQVDRRDPTEFRFGTTLPYARFHDLGTGGEKKRELIELTPAEQHQIRKIVSAYIARAEA